MGKRAAALLWSCFGAKTQVKNTPPTPCKRLIIDLDETLIVVHDEYLDFLLSEHYPHLTMTNSAYAYPFYLIHKELTAKFFKEVLAIEKLEICIMTAGSHDKDILLALEQEYGLPCGSLYLNCIFINRVKTCFKGTKIRQLINQGIFHPRDFILLLDDQQLQLDSAEEEGFAAVLATGFLPVKVAGKKYIMTEPSYLITTLKKIYEAKLEPCPTTSSTTFSLGLSPQIL